MYIEITMFIVYCILLVITSAILVKSLVKIASFLKISEFILSFILVGLSTSLPEMMVSVSSAKAGLSQMALGNVIGSNIANLTIVGGIMVLLARGLKAETKLIRKDAYWMFSIALLSVVLMLIGKELSRLDAIILIAAYAFYMYKMVQSRKQYTQGPYNNNYTRWGILGNFLLFLITLPLLFYFSEQIVSTGARVAINLHLPTIFIGLFFIALGTSLPELLVGTKAALTGHHGLALGNIMGSVVVNSTLVLAIAALIQPITGNLFLFTTSSMFMITICLLFAVFLETKNRITWREGIVLIMMYVLFLLVELNLKSFYILNGV